ncbi:Lrp/AsnC ligand binding domain-containing protein [Rhodanobacter sp. MP7CTX1]|uniref:Lrp/AsnC ligand binding domain-containing protein n=1 Tax=Rhodanobacter sp. MP7CTX1 TaxID=2723084 RepID=UPI00179E7D2C|nr:Lrp/AsnC ligand binding domain-containing protein [Rhodanobacter sp. MP7CTX1]MBB6186452.1 DNA-binding Lrp family transcriptional regulator [Rhodanobacter sp. MP7CTX1]
MTFIVGVELERERADMLDAFRKGARADPNVQQCYYVTGEADFILIVVARDVDDFESFTRRLLFDNANIRRFTTNVVTARDKVGNAAPIQARTSQTQSALRRRHRRFAWLLKWPGSFPSDASRA